jgi:hypothetical protein
MILKGKVPSTRRKTCLCAALCATHTTWPGMESELGLRRVRQAEGFVENNDWTCECVSDRMLEKSTHGLAA